MIKNRIKMVNELMEKMEMLENEIDNIILTMKNKERENQSIEKELTVFEKIENQIDKIYNIYWYDKHSDLEYETILDTYNELVA